MKPLLKLVRALAVLFVAFAVARAAEIDGKWKAEFESQIGQLKYVFEFKADGATLTGKATSDREGQSSTTEIKEGKVTKDEVSFVETLKFQDQEIRIEYKGKVAGDELKLHRKVGDFAEYDIVAKRVKEDAPAKK
ncbi:MAG TPA: hypothetical protein VHD62_17270 [Opitutaceae bacterium]|nr:hypothetical protein [Opitutaceae bacterium]